ncbi:MAG TPA: alpha/beta family hydrolase [Acidimicrobiia bacterium]
MPEPIALTTADGLTLEAELAPAAGRPRAGVVLCHPHPQYGGTMRSIVVSALFEALPADGVTCVRFNFRGVEGSEGAYDEGNRERIDAEAALAALEQELRTAGLDPDAVPHVVAGWSFGADMALSVRAPSVTAWLAIAPPLRFVHDLEGLARDPRPKLLVLAQHDEVREPGEVAAAAQQWANTEVQVVGGASHFFMGRTDRLVEAATGYLDRLTGRGPAASPGL